MLVVFVLDVGIFLISDLGFILVDDLVSKNYNVVSILGVFVLLLVFVILGIFI